MRVPFRSATFACASFLPLPCGGRRFAGAKSSNRRIGGFRFRSLRWTMGAELFWPSRRLPARFHIIIQKPESALWSGEGPSMTEVLLPENGHGSFRGWTGARRSRRGRLLLPARRCIGHRARILRWAFCRFTVLLALTIIMISRFHLLTVCFVTETGLFP